MDRQEVWEHIVGALEREFTYGEFEVGELRVKVNDAMRSITVIEPSTSQAFMLLDVTGATFSGGRNPGDATVVQLPPSEENVKAVMIGHDGEPISFID